jgi:hypothetical protein
MQVGDWSLDHLLVDQRGTLTFVEAKLLQNPEARRAVIGQILDYAAYAAENWGDGRLRQLSADYWQENGRNVDDIVREGLGETDTENFWRSVESNLEQGKIRLVIVADELQPEVRRVIEFLNQQMRTVQVFGLEIRCFGDEPHTVVVPYLIGQTQATATQKGASGAGRNWTIEELRAAYSDLDNPVVSKRLLAFLNWAVERNCAVPGRGTQNPIFQVVGRREDYWIVQVAPRWIYPRLKPTKWTDTNERDQFVADLKQIDLYPADFDAGPTTDGKNTRKLEELSEAQFEAFLNVLAKYCRPRRSGAAGNS